MYTELPSVGLVLRLCMDTLVQDLGELGLEQ